MAGEWHEEQLPKGKNFSKKKQSQLCMAPSQNGWQKHNASEHTATAERQSFTPAELASCQITVNQAKIASMRGKAVFVDVRTAADYELVHISSSLNIPEHTLASRTFLKNRPFIIIGKGHRTRNLAERCVSLKKKGFRKVSVLQGGIASWVQAGYPVNQNNKSSVKEIFTLSPRELAATAGRQKWSIAGMGPEISLINKIFSSERIIKVPDTDESFIKRNSRSSSEIFNPVLIIGAPGYDKNLVRRMTEKGWIPVFYLDGGVAYYLEYRKTHQRKVEHAAMAFESLVKCPGS